MSIGMLKFYPDGSAMFDLMFRRYVCEVSELAIDGTALKRMSGALQDLSKKAHECCLHYLAVNRAGDGLKELLLFVGERAHNLIELHIARTTMIVSLTRC